MTVSNDEGEEDARGKQLAILSILSGGVLLLGSVLMGFAMFLQYKNYALGLMSLAQGSKIDYAQFVSLAGKFGSAFLVIASLFVALFLSIVGSFCVLRQHEILLRGSVKGNANFMIFLPGLVLSSLGVILIIVAMVAGIE